MSALPLGRRAAGALKSFRERASGARSQEEPIPTPHGWRTRGYLPHFDAADTWQAITYRLGDAIPKQTLKTLEKELAGLPPDDQHQQRRARLESWADAGYGKCLLPRHDVAEIVWENWHRFEGQRYDIGAWVIMPNHVHILIRIYSEWPLESILRSWKSYTAKRIVTMTGAEAPLWLGDYWDRFMRDEGHWLNTRHYIEHNPVSAGLAAQPEDWHWSSAGFPPG